MISNISVRGYKCLKDVSLQMSSLNILAGPNSSGKSSLLQLFLLLRQSAELNGEVHQMNLSGELYDGGLATDVLHPEADYSIDIDLRIEERDHMFSFKLDRTKPESTSARSLEKSGTEGLRLPVPVYGSNFIYLNAERTCPKVTFELPTDRIGLAGSLGKHGEYTTAILAKAALLNKCVPDWDNRPLQGLVKKAPKDFDRIDIVADIDASRGRLDLVSNQMLGWILPGSTFEAQESPSTDSAILRYIRDPDAAQVRVRPTHIGFGLTYALPIIVAGLSMPTGSIILIENPEAHLHPFSQSRLGVFAAIVAACGCQVLVETHSDHFVNGVRIAVANGILASELLKINYFGRPDSGTTANVSNLHCDSNGRIANWPSGFFDQIEEDLSRLL